MHKHVILEHGRTRAAQVYPEELCRAICKGLQQQMQLDAKGQFLLMNIDAQENATSQELKKSADNLKQTYKTVGGRRGPNGNSMGRRVRSLVRPEDGEGSTSGGDGLCEDDAVVRQGTHHGM